jgi:hypothetical protein
MHTVHSDFILVTGKIVALCKNPSFVGVKCYAPLGYARLFEADNTPRFCDMPGYTRAKMVDGLKKALERRWFQFQMAGQAFGRVSFWMDVFPLKDLDDDPPLWHDLNCAMATQFNGVTRPRLALSQENCATCRPGPNLASGDSGVRRVKGDRRMCKAI